MPFPEILAPAGGPAQLTAAVRAGCDAVYLGTRGFNARRNAENFSAETLGETVAYCHARNVRVHVTVNTMVTDAELPALEAEAELIAQSGADAVILQDLAAARLFRERCPSIQRHASTQMAIHNADGVSLARDMGFHRVVLARELSLEEIESLAKNAGIELEVFIHGALCECLSGACYMSSVIGERSGNRGLCAQPCRTDFKCGGRSYALSLKDLSAEKYLPRLVGAGVASFKIEGRMKRPEYVAAAVDACVKARSGEPYDTDTLRSVFSRGGFTDGHLTGKRGPEMFGVRTQEDAEASKAVLGSLAGLYRRERPSVGVDMSLTLRLGQPARLLAECGGLSVSAEGPEPESARSVPADEAFAEKCLSKTGGTPFYVNRISLDIDPAAALSSSALNAMRRETLEKLELLRSKAEGHAFSPVSCFHRPEPHAAPEKPALWARFQSLSQLPEDISCISRVILPAEALAAGGELPCPAEMLAAELLPAAFPQFEAAQRARLQKLKAMGLRAVYTENLYGVELGRRMGLEIIGGPCLNAANTFALEELEKLGAAAATVSFELSMAKIKAMGGALPRGALIYGRLPLMRLRACPARGPGGCGSCGGSAVLTDRMGVDFPLICSGKMFSTVLNSLPLYVGDKELSGLDFALLYFTVEPKNECRRIMRLAAEGGALSGKKTAGLYYRSVK